MRGKKSDSAFVAEFIAESVQKGMETPDQIVQSAKDQITQIDEEIRAIEAKKIRRSKLLDVILNFEKIAKDKTEEARLLPFFSLEYPDVCKHLCTIIKVQPIPADPQMYSGTLDHKSVFAVKQLLERKVIARKDGKLIPGERFGEYWKFVLHED